jgi:hypothetical protein
MEDAFVMMHFAAQQSCIDHVDDGIFQLTYVVDLELLEQY